MIWPSLSDPTIENRILVLTKRLDAKAAQSSEKTHLVRNNELLMDVEDRMECFVHFDKCSQLDVRCKRRPRQSTGEQRPGFKVLLA